MPADLVSAFDQTRTIGHPDHVRDVDAVLVVTSHAKDADDARLLLDVLGLSDAAPTALTLLKLGQLRRPSPNPKGRSHE